MVLRIFYGPNCCGCRPDDFDVFGAYDLQTPGPEWWNVLSLLIKRYKEKDCTSAYFSVVKCHITTPVE